MSTEVQAKLDAGYLVIAEKLGQEYTLYPFNLMSPLDSANADATPIQVAVSADPMFTAPLKYNKAVWICYGDRSRLQRFYFLDGPYGTFYIGDRQPYQPMQAVRCNKRLSIGRLEYSTSGALSSSIVNFAEDLPAFFQFAREDIQKPDVSLGQTMGRAVTHWTAFIPADIGTLKQDDLVVDETGIKYTIDAPDFTNMGYVCHLRLATQ